ncbi:MAG: META domain-containing protein [Saprospiraceae bacterium]
MFILLLAAISCTPLQKENENKTPAESPSPPHVEENLHDKYWKLVELNGKKVSDYPAQNKEPYLKLLKEGSKAEGTGGCNVMGGTYTLTKPNKVSFSQMASTKMACPDMTLETDFQTVLTQIDIYVVGETTLTFTDLDGSSFAKFEVDPSK